MNCYLTFHEEKPGYFKVRFGEVLVAELIQDVDGYFYAWLISNGGSIPSYILRGLADKLDELNSPWDEELSKILTSN